MLCPEINKYYVQLWKFFWKFFVDFWIQ